MIDSTAPEKTAWKRQGRGPGTDDPLIKNDEESAWKRQGRGPGNNAPLNQRQETHPNCFCHNVAGQVPVLARLSMITTRPRPSALMLQAQMGISNCQNYKKGEPRQVFSFLRRVDTNLIGLSLDQWPRRDWICGVY